MDVPSLSAPRSIRSDHDFPTAVTLCVVHQQRQRFSLWRLDQRKEILRLRKFKAVWFHIKFLFIFKWSLCGVTRTLEFDSVQNRLKIADKQILLPATPGLRQQCSPNKASVQPDQQVNSVPHPERTFDWQVNYNKLNKQRPGKINDKWRPGNSPWTLQYLF